MDVVVAFVVLVLIILSLGALWNWSIGATPDADDRE